MSKLEDEYYVLEIDRNTTYFFTNDKIPNKKVELDGNPIAKFYPRPHSGNSIITGPLMLGPRYMISKSIFKAINKFEQKGVQFLPVIVNDGEDEFNYHVVNFYEEMPWIDLDKSIYEDEDLTLHGVEKLVLNKELMDSVKDSDKKIFSPEECPDLFICHKDVVDEIIKFYRAIYDDTVDGIKFTKLSQFTKE